jgi:hypothetical protein
VERVEGGCHGRRRVANKGEGEGRPSVGKGGWRPRKRKKGGRPLGFFCGRTETTLQMTSDVASNGPQPFPTSTHRIPTFGQHFFLGYYTSATKWVWLWGPVARGVPRSGSNCSPVHTLCYGLRLFVDSELHISNRGETPLRMFSIFPSRFSTRQF